MRLVCSRYNKLVTILQLFHVNIESKRWSMSKILTKKVTLPSIGLVTSVSSELDVLISSC